MIGLSDSSVWKKKGEVQLQIFLCLWHFAVSPSHKIHFRIISMAASGNTLCIANPVLANDETKPPWGHPELYKRFAKKPGGGPVSSVPFC